MNDELMALLQQRCPRLWELLGGKTSIWDGDALDELRQLLDTIPRETLSRAAKWLDEEYSATLDRHRAVPPRPRDSKLRKEGYQHGKLSGLAGLSALMRQWADSGLPPLNTRRLTMTVAARRMGGGQ